MDNKKIKISFEIDKNLYDRYKQALVYLNKGRPASDLRVYIGKVIKLYETEIIEDWGL